MPTQLLLLLHLYEALTVPVYLRIIYVLLDNPKFRRVPFWRIFRLMAISDLFGYVFGLLLYRFPLLPQFVPFYMALPASHWIGLASGLAFLNVYQQNLLHIFISLNRFTGIWFPSLHEKFWHRWTRLCLFGSFIGALALTLNRLFTVGQFRPFFANDTSRGLLVTAVSYGLLETNKPLISMVFISFCALSCLALNSLTICLIVRRHQKQEQQQSHGQGMELGLFLITLWTMLTQLLYNGVELLAYLAIYSAVGFPAMEKLHLLISQMPWMSDLYSLSQVWVALILSVELRKVAFPRVYNKVAVLQQQQKQHQKQPQHMGIGHCSSPAAVIPISS